ncbi:peptidoglycan editing factor PgeF [Phytoactinopolyspora mesophila]|uniref:Purine nucleoside phosphorylase n=1 Tax=Phytoactinopolyspora mesophila TaxID=2650750 RepID=A0A7K3M9V4_9ACTN|nr:peptidoglycan editing factor PgeF [Phytoactinopolyspora mesophila]
MIAHFSTHGAASFAFTDRTGGSSAAPFDQLNLARHVGDDPAAVEKNRSALAAHLGLRTENVVYMNQVHGADVAVIDGPWPTDVPPPEVDAMVTTRPGLALAVLVADCVPVLLADPAAGVAAVAHAGRPGMAAGVVAAVTDTMYRLGAQQLVGHVGPAVCGGCYEVPESLRAEVAEAVPSSWATTRWGTAALDVPAGVTAQLRDAGVRLEEGPWKPDVRPCTVEHEEFFSYRRDRITGRFAGITWLAA